MASGIKVSLILPPESDERWNLAKQIGVSHAVIHTGNLGEGTLPTEYDLLLQLQNRFRDAGFDIQVIAGGTPLTDTARLGRPGREQEINEFCDFLRNVGSLDIPVVNYNWSVGPDWQRTSVTIPSRGGSLVSGYDHREMQRHPDFDIAPVTEEELWESLEHFLNRVVPVAEQAGVKLALHPDDPPLPSVRGVSRIVRSVEAYDRILDIYPSDANGVTFCQGNFIAMDADIPGTIRHFGEDIHNVHFRDIEGTAEKFVETWHDNGPTDMLETLRVLDEIEYDGPMRPDHVPTMAGESNDLPGYEMKGRLFTIGYITGLLESLESS